MDDEPPAPARLPIPSDSVVRLGARGSPRTYRLLEFRPLTEPLLETFAAPGDEEALERVIAVLPETPFELWCGRRLVSRRLRP